VAIALQTTTGLGSEMAPLHLAVEREDLFLTQHPLARGLWLPVRFVTLPDGSRLLHAGGRATPRAGN
jgi:hypothetical protein